jgi:HEPN domain-containing protein
MKDQVKEWLALADEDIETADILINHKNCKANQIAFHCQQAIEKYFKAYLLENNWELKKTHNLTKLYNIAKTLTSKDFSIDTKLLDQIHNFYINSRYPGEYVAISKKRAKEFYDFAENIGKIIKKALNIKTEKIDDDLGLED